MIEDFGEGFTKVALGRVDVCAVYVLKEQFSYLNLATPYSG